METTIFLVKGITADNQQLNKFVISNHSTPQGFKIDEFYAYGITEQKLLYRIENKKPIKDMVKVVSYLKVTNTDSVFKNFIVLLIKYTDWLRENSPQIDAKDLINKFFTQNNLPNFTYMETNFIKRVYDSDIFNIPDVSVSVAEILKPEYANTAFTWHQIKNAIKLATER